MSILSSSLGNSYKRVQLTRIANSPDESVIDCLQPVDIHDRPIAGNDELLLRVRLTAIHPCDLLCCAGLVSRTRSGSAADNANFLPGIEACASIEMVGDSLRKEFSVGQRVSVKAWAPWGDWQEANGVWSEYLVVKKESVVLLPDTISDTGAAMFLSVSLTSYVMMVCALGLQSGDWLVQAAAGSALGRWIIAFAEDRGINLINLVRREDQVAELKRNTNAQHVLHCPSDGSQADELVESISQITKGQSIKGGLDPISDGVAASIMLRVMSRYGTVLKFGALGGSEMHLSRPALLKMSQEGLQVKGFSIQNWWIPDTPDRTKRLVFDDLISIVENNPNLGFRISSLYSFDEIGNAIRASLGTKSAKVFMVPTAKDKHRYRDFLDTKNLIE
ncbi:MAG: hypothetical protein P8I38_07230 [Arenicella sp.]|nr:hypothetical protein [Arenicella sp.]